MKRIVPLVPVQAPAAPFFLAPVLAQAQTAVGAYLTSAGQLTPAVGRKVIP